MRLLTAVLWLVLTSTVAYGAVRAPLPRQPAPVTCPGGGSIVPLNPGDLYAAVASGGLGKTYELTPGHFTVSATILLNQGTTCFIGQDGVQISIDTGVGNNRAFVVNSGAKLGLRMLGLDGQGSSAGISLEGSTLELTDVVMQRMLGDEQPGSALDAKEGSSVVVTRTDFLDNASPFAGAVFIRDSSTITLTDVNMLRNTGDAGALFVASGSTASFEGSNTVSDNSAPTNGGAFYIGAFGPGRSTVIINGRMCASGNRAATDGGTWHGGFVFADIRGTLVFGDNAEVLLGGNTPDAVYVKGDDNAAPGEPGIVQCGAGGTSWDRGDTSSNPSIGVGYDITGAACACDAAFQDVDGFTATCDGCGGQGWQAAACACRCTNLGQGCCQFDGTVSPQNTVCRPPGPCDPIGGLCSGASGECPDDGQLPDNTQCRKVVHKVLPYHPTSRHRSYTGVLDQTLDSAVEAQDYGKHAAHDGYHDTRDHLRWGLPVTKVCTGVCKSGVCELSAEEIKHCTSGYA